ncbi:MAG TPA: sigma-54 dependent transcriptional regulator [Nitrospira sp.]|nr:sigma-54 dependent transcriptional regulator [Nitrospira sp.]
MHAPIVALITADPASKTAVELALSDQKASLLVATTMEAGLRLLAERQDLTLVICDDSGGRITRKSVLAQAGQSEMPIPVVILGESDTAVAAVNAIKEGAVDYLPKPVTVDAIKASIRAPFILHPATSPPLQHELTAFEHIVSVSPQMQLVKRLAGEVAVTDATVLITGESGTGKELFARAIHAASPRSKGPFLALNCAGIPEPLLESELFGYQRGAFTDAKHTKPGKFQLATGGTLFLDEIGEMSLPAQAKLLRVLEDHVVDPLGDTRSVKVNIRIIAATNEDLPAQIKGGRFRLDLFYRLNVYQLRLPPLRDRPEDIEPILRSFLDRAREHRGCRIQGIAPEALALLERHDWPGNVRELHNVVEGLTITCKSGTIHPDHLPSTFWTGKGSAATAPSSEKASLLAFGLSFQEMEKKMLEEALRKAAGNVSEASRLLKITRNTLRYRMAKYHIS